MLRETLNSEFFEVNQERFLSEFLLYPFWESIKNKKITSESGDVIHILSPGIRNFGEGPDYKNCFFLLNKSKKVHTGDVEIHVRASDWLRHGHQKNSAYSHVRLHVFEINDTDLSGLEYKPFLNVQINPTEKEKTRRKIPQRNVAERCRAVANWNKTIYEDLSDAGFKKLKEKGKRIHEIANNETIALLLLILRVHGQVKNSDIFLNAGINVVQNIEMCKKLNIEEMFIALCGSSRLLHFLLEKKGNQEGFREKLLEYFSQWERLKKKHAFKELTYSPWSITGNRPQNAPAIRFLQFACLVRSMNISSLSKTVSKSDMDIKELRKIFIVKVKIPQSLHEFIAPFFKNYSLEYSDSMLENIAIDALIPWTIVKKKNLSKKDLLEKFSLLKFPTQKNSKLSFFAQGKDFNALSLNLFQKQGLLWLYDNFCMYRDISCESCIFRPEP
ncbi:MAG: DUF2851 family protein [Nitrospinae bacterium]|nr:DUF2851 family protein [Nitrospinota bacterium]